MYPELERVHRLQEQANRLKAALAIRKKLGSGRGDLGMRLRLTLDALEVAIRECPKPPAKPITEQIENLIVPQSAIISRGCVRPRKQP